MNLKKSVKIALAKKEIKHGVLAEKMGMKVNTLSGILSKNNPSSNTIGKIAEALEMSASELIALGE
ncbi:MAG: helix-turn-helix domain-containing protein [Desulfuromonadales bacterium]|nr:helix-turn-helix domain-containing protein [Desulfuromonadales bacterium]